LLETTDHSIERVARDSGFSTDTNLGYHFARITGVSRQTYRYVFRHRASTQGAVG
jgi:transcriptional regulator GlxA family with amidase domain